MSQLESGHSAPPHLRADAERNRTRIVAAAGNVFAVQGVQAPLSEVAHAAGVGVATLYRRFPLRSDLIAAVYLHRMARHAQLVENALANPDPWAGFQGYLQAACDLQEADHGLSNALRMKLTHDNTREIEQARNRDRHGLRQLITKAQKSGGLRPDFSEHDMPLLLMAHAGVLNTLGRRVPEATPRIVAYLIAAVATPQEPQKLPPAPTAETIDAALAPS